MSKIKLMFAVALAVLVLCLSACGGSKDAGATPDAASSQSSTEKTVSQAQGTDRAAETAASGETSVSSAQSKADSNQQGAVSDDSDTGVDERSDAPARSEDSSAQNSGNENNPQKTGQSGSVVKPDGNQSRQETDSKAENPDLPSSGDSGDRDNAEVSINDL